MDEDKVYGADYNALIENRLSKIKIAQNRELIDDFLIEINVMKRTKAMYAYILRDLSNYVKKPFKKMTRQDIREFYKKEKDRLHASSMNTVFTKIKRFFRWLNGDEEYPPSVRWIKTVKTRSTKGEKQEIKEKIIPREMYVKILENCDHPRDKAFISFMWDTGCRVNELTFMKIKDLELDGAIPRAFVGEKRWIPLFESITFLISYLSVHPHRMHPDAPLWHGQKGPLTVRGFDKSWRRAKKRAGYPKIKLHWLRHTRATEHAMRNISESHMKQVMGWVPGSKTPAIYIHLVDEDALKVVGEAYGLEIPEEEQEEKEITKLCYRCARENPIEARYCNVCGMPFDLQAAQEREATEDILAKAILTNPKIKEIIREEFLKLSKEE